MDRNYQNGDEFRREERRTTEVEKCAHDHASLEGDPPYSHIECPDCGKRWPA